MKKLVVLDQHVSAGSSLSYQHFSELASITCYDRTPDHLIAERVGDASYVITNKCRLDRDIFSRCRNLEYIGVVATGYNTIDIEAAREYGIAVCNAPDYSSKSVAQLVFAYILDAYSLVNEHDRRVKNGEWENCIDFSFYDERLEELDGKTLGLIGFGGIGKRVSALAHAFDMNVVVYTRTVTDQLKQEHPNISFLPLEAVLRQSDILSIHCPLTEDTRNLINGERLALMHQNAVLINTARGPVVNEQDLADALNNGTIARAYADVLSTEPPKADNPLLTAKNITITPHIAWTPRQTRARLIDIVYDNLKQYIEGTPVNRVDR